MDSRPRHGQPRAAGLVASTPQRTRVNARLATLLPRNLGQDIGPLSFSTTPYYGLTVGNVYTFANTGFNIRLRPGSNKWQDTPSRVRPAMPGTGFFEIPEKKWGWYLFAGIDGRAVARNIFLDGNTFGSSPGINKFPLVADANAGVALTYDQLRISYTLVYRTKEFHDQQAPETSARSVWDIVLIGPLNSQQGSDPLMQDHKKV